MAERPEHKQALEVLATLNVDFLKDASCWFAGGTAISLRCDEFRISRDLDFLCSSRQGYRLLRERIHDDGARGLFRQQITLKRDVRADRYGIRFILDVSGTPVKFEIVNENRIDLEGVDDESLPVARLSDHDLVATKLIANDDRFREESALARDVIDLIMLEHELGELPAAGWAKARQAYGESIDRIYYRALQRLRDDSALLQKIFDALSISEKARIVIHQRLSKNP